MIYPIGFSFFFLMFFIFILITATCATMDELKTKTDENFKSEQTMHTSVYIDVRLTRRLLSNPLQ